MSSPVDSSDYAKIYSLHPDYVAAVDRKICEFMAQQDESGLTNFFRLIGQDPHLPGLLAHLSKYQSCFFQDALLTLIKNTSDPKIECADCLRLLTDQQEGAQGQACVEEDAHMASALPAASELLPSMLPQDPSDAIISAFAQFVKDMESRLQNNRSHAQEANQGAYFSDSTSDDEDDAKPAKQMARQLTELYASIVQEQGGNPKVIEAALDTYERCPYAKGIRRRFWFYKEIATSLCACSPGSQDISIAISLVNFFPSHIFSLDQDLLSNQIFFSSVLSKHPVLFFFLPEAIQQLPCVPNILAEDLVPVFVIIDLQQISIDTFRIMQQRLNAISLQLSPETIQLVCRIFRQNRSDIELLQREVSIYEQYLRMFQCMYQNICEVYHHLCLQQDVVQGSLDEILEQITDRYNKYCSSIENLIVDKKRTIDVVRHHALDVVRRHALSKKRDFSSANDDAP